MIPVTAHGIGGVYQLPVPLWLYLAGAAVAVAASFVVVARRSPAVAEGVGAYTTTPVPGPISVVARVVLRFAGLAWWYGAIAVGFIVGDISPLPAVLLWVGIWVGLPIVSVLIGNPWPSLSPFRSTFAVLEWMARRVGLERLDLGLHYPPSVARWPAVTLLGLAIWCELILPGRQVAGTVALLMLGYTVLTLAGMACFGPLAWLRHAELFEVLLGWFGRIGPVARSSRSARLCAGCEEACVPSRCIDCPECAAAADDEDRQAVLRRPIVGLADTGRAGWSDVVFIVLALAGITYDGARETPLGSIAFNLLYPPVAAILGPTSALTFHLVETLQLAAVLAAFLAAFAGVVALTALFSGGRSDISLAARAGRYAPTLLPIAAGYLIAHYLTLVIQGILWLPALIADPLMSLAPQLDAIPTGAIWYLSVIAIVGGHVAGIVLAHRRVLTETPGRATLVGLPMVALMIGYTVLSLWIIATPIVVEPGVTPLAVSR